MSNARPALVGIVLMAGVVWLVPASADEKADRDKDEASINQVRKRWQEAWNRHDPKALASLVAEDVDFVNVWGGCG